MTSSAGQDRPMAAGDCESGITSCHAGWQALPVWTGPNGNMVSPEDDEAADEKAAVRAARQLQGGGERAAASGGQAGGRAGGRTLIPSVLAPCRAFVSRRCCVFPRQWWNRAANGAGEGRLTTSLPRSVQAQLQAMEPPSLRPGSAMRPMMAHHSDAARQARHVSCLRCWVMTPPRRPNARRRRVASRWGEAATGTSVMR
ncbi:hypothetical protein Vretifemale_20589 [Volvox reticuliferus]|uniref:Uncharacterized protein n=1 Tax=Volvox reticuliferus TaxID=1737510 RepID=A0A8J4D180_9CHLO|nr:hypothetical protein Vretifemale_20589 [Volvox reticuliferus]